MVDHDPGFEPKCCNEASGVGAIVGFQAYEGNPFFFDQLAGSSGEHIAISAGTHEQGPSLLEMVTRYSSKDSDAFASAFGISHRRQNPSHRKKATGQVCQNPA